MMPHASSIICLIPRKPAISIICLIPGSLETVSPVVDVVTPKHATELEKSPETGEKLPAPQKRELLRALTEQQQKLSLLLMAKQKRSQAGNQTGGSLYAARFVRAV